jgi:hypothetical protein
MSSISVLAVPALLYPSQRSTHPPPQTPTARQFATMYAIGRLTQPPATIATALSFFYLACHSHHGSATLAHGRLQEWQLWACGGAAVLSALWPFTFLLLEPVSRRLLVLAEESEEKGESGGEEVQTLLYQWGVLNLIRACLPAVGAVCGFGAVFFVGR